MRNPAKAADRLVPVRMVGSIAKDAVRVKKKGLFSCLCASRSLLRITLPPEYEGRAAVKDLVDRLMGRNPEHRFMFIQNRAGDLDRDLIDA